MSKMSVQRGCGRVQVTLSDDANSRVEVTLDEGEASALGTLLLDMSGDAIALQDKPETPTIMDPVALRASARRFVARRLNGT
ncbi:hypothetical protein PY365_04440 [Roseiarcaceae bacterium H3SJ34-1]|uniref:hypothetical protein n=1 Tax=Terripilifer ovatus TaxID=3032367 RepID=UPI003AB923AC|nr:hypothetical protein [Roseiarcaceae bacterium H3SJ34-1]